MCRQDTIQTSRLFIAILQIKEFCLLGSNYWQTEMTAILDPNGPLQSVGTAEFLGDQHAVTRKESTAFQHPSLEPAIFFSWHRFDAKLSLRSYYWCCTRFADALLCSLCIKDCTKRCLKLVIDQMLVIQYQSVRSAFYECRLLTIAYRVEKIEYVIIK